jgi:putative membrane protein
MMWGYSALNWWWMAPMMVLFWGGAIALLVLAVRSGTGTTRGSTDKAVETLRARFASGDITEDEFEKSKRFLQG